MRSPISRRTAPSRPRRPPRIRSRNACGPRCVRRACASSTSSPARSTTNGTSSCRRRRSRRRRSPAPSSRRCAKGWKTCIPAMSRRNGSPDGATIRKRWKRSSRHEVCRMLPIGSIAHLRTGIWCSGTSALADLAKGLAAGKIKVVDLTETLSPEFPYISLPPEMGQAWPFRIEEVSHYDERGPAWYWNNFSSGEHTGTHFDAPAHWITGRGGEDVAAVPARKLVGPAAVLDFSEHAAADPDFLLEVDHVREWETTHGPLPAG